MAMKPRLCPALSGELFRRLPHTLAVNLLPKYDGRPNGHGSINIACKVSLLNVLPTSSRIHQAYASKVILISLYALLA